MGWGSWLAKNHSNSDRIWLRFFKKHSGISTVTHAEALDRALCFDWIDGQLHKSGEHSWLRSKKNIEHTVPLCEANRMKPARLRQIEAAKTDDRWARAYDSPKATQRPEEFLGELAKNKRAQNFFETLDRVNRLRHRLATANRQEA